MNERDIKILLNKWITELELIRPRHIIIVINGLHFFVNKIEYDKEHCLLYLDNILIGVAYFSNIDTIELY